MRIQDLLKTLPAQGRAGDLGDFEVRGLAANSKAVGRDYVFVAVKGAAAHGREHVREALERGARVIVTDTAESLGMAVPVIVVPDSRKALGDLGGAFYGNPSRHLKVAGVTGTNGKTTITYLIEALLLEARRVPGVIGTINYRFKDTVIESKNTTPGALDLQKLLSDMVAAGVEYAVMEVSSHALDQDRIAGISFCSAIFTNLTQDHLDYHRHLEAYFLAKAKLFTNLDESAFAVLNGDDPYGRRLVSMAKGPVITYGIESECDVRARDVVSSNTGTAFLVETPAGIDVVRTRLVGRHNIYNILACVAWGTKEGLALGQMMQAIERFKPVPGRFERILSHAPFSVFVDYAHTDDALRNCIEALRPLTGGRIIVVFGCGGDRDRTKRPKMGNTVTCLADFAVITSDNPRSEDPAGIIDDICSGVVSTNFSVVADRREAIRAALALARAGDIVLVAGKGHETVQILNDSAVHFDDREEIRSCLRSMNY